MIISAELYSRWSARQTAQPAPVAATYKVTLKASVAGAEISVNGQPCGQSSCDVELAPGDYRAEARLPDYQSASANFHVSAGQSQADVALTLIANPPLVTISTDLTQGTVLLNGALTAQIQGGDVEIPKLAPGTYTLVIENGAFRASAPLEIAGDEIPKVTGPIQVQGMTGLVLSHSGDEARLYASDTGLMVTLDGQPAGTLSPNGLPFEHLAPGSHEVLIEQPGGQNSKLAFTSGTPPAVLASLVTNRNLGVLDIQTGEDDAEVFLNGEKYRRTTKNGRLRIYLAPKSYSVRVQKNGFAAAQEQTVELRGGAEAKIEFKLARELATLTIHRGVPGSEISLDGNRIGVTGTDGEFSATNIQPGKHTVSIRNDRYKPLESDQTFAAGKATEIEGRLQSLFGALKIEVNPPVAGAHLKLRREGDAQDREITDTTLNLAEGSYTVTASASGYQDAVATVKVTAGGAASASMVLKRIETAVVASAPAVAKKAGFQLDDWFKTGQWARDGKNLQRQGGDFVLAPIDFRQANLRFTVALLRGKRIDWVLGFRDPKNYVLLQMDGSNFERVEVVDGKKGKTTRVPYAMKRSDPLRVTITVSGKGIVHTVSSGEQTTTLDDWNPAGGPPAGQFGFHIPGRDEISLSELQILPN